MGEDGPLHRAKRVELGVLFGMAKLLLEVGISLGFAANRGDRAVDILGRFAEAAAAGDESADFASFAVVEDARTAGAVKFWATREGIGFGRACGGGGWFVVHGGTSLIQC